ncbi:ferredoxin [Mycobacterium koreense]|uniref:Uncharacterized protein n=1 Tax=Mycolicibacillus koreensis TaxID=1069220 RepID=A0A7I7SKZ6_9MYCO|nr:ferredoxin [Mycolicibacillus koreensis]MCV7247415.1 ferredoxin [Mycolicibacillus koreensis]OSC33956.1 hypothetical protein B8W67_08950 [Mycolicibacillus koreensis]BBY56616.1 hypothetical protein MKOR_38670 [Mycolicibacillus koreensis]
MDDETDAGAYEVVIDQDICMAAGYCYRSHPQLFSEGEYGIAELIGGVPPGSTGPGPVALDAGEQLANAQEASRVCPSGAITVLPRSG